MATKQQFWTIYCHTHVESGRRYIGLTKKTMLQRWNQHAYCAFRKVGKGCAHFWNAIRLYGKDAFSHEVLRQCASLEEANAYEAYFIDLFRTRDPELGFNLEPGGKHEPHPIRKNPWDDPAFREKNLPGFVAAGQSPEARARSKAALNTSESRTKRSAAAKAAMARPDVQQKRQAFQQDPAFRSKIGSSLKKTLSTPDARARMSAASAASATPEVRAKRGESIKRALANPEVRARVSAAARAALSDPEVQARMAIGRKRAWAKPGYRDKMSVIMRGKKHSSEAIERMRQAYAGRPGVRVDKAALAELERLAAESPDAARARVQAALDATKSLPAAADLLGVHFLTVRKLAKRLGCHLWRERPLNGTDHHRYEFKKDSDEVVDLYTQFTVFGVQSLRVCELCGQESVNGGDPKEPCSTALARQIMES